MFYLPRFCGKFQIMKQRFNEENFSREFSHLISRVVDRKEPENAIICGKITVIKRRFGVLISVDTTCSNIAKYYRINIMAKCCEKHCSSEESGEGQGKKSLRRKFEKKYKGKCFQ